MSNHIDLHLHSTASDGADTIPELLNKVIASNTHSFSVTDHDTIEGSIEMEKLVPDYLHYIRGIEFSCTTSFKKCHILGYDFNPESSVFQDVLNLGIRLRQEKTLKRIAFWESEFGIVLTDEEAQWLHSQKSPGRPNFGKIIVDRGLAPDIPTAIKKYVSPCKVGKDRIDASVAIDAIFRAEGIPVWAHPLGGEGEKRLTKEEFQIQFQELLSNGIKGLECYYSRYSQDDISFLVEQANAHGLLISGGSDYHGTNKPNLHIGKMSEDNMDVKEENLTLYTHFVK